jgi:CRISPR type III-A-associated RAMP protein Csm4
MPTYLALLNPLAPYHAGIDGDLAESDVVIHSDTLHAALFQVALDIGEDPSPLGTDTAPPDILLSSVFPAWHKLPFFPKPLLRIDLGDRDRIGKTLKSIRFVSKSVFRDILAGKEVDISGNGLRCGPFLFHPQDEPHLKARHPSARLPDSPWIHTEATAANVIDRSTSLSGPFQRGEVLVDTHRGGRLFFLFQAGPDREVWLESLIRELGVRGIGGERSTGKGAFRLETIEPFPMEDLANPSGTAFLTLSLFNPKRQEVEFGVLDPPAAYQAVKRGGWIGHAQSEGRRKRKVRFLTEGSIFPAPAARGDIGRILNVAPRGYKHPVYRSGLAFPVFFDPSALPNPERSAL